MTYLTYLFDNIYVISNTIKIPIPISPTKVYNLSIFSVFIGVVILSLIVYFILRLLNFEVNYGFKLFGRYQDDAINYDTQKSSIPNRQRSGAPRVRKGDVRYKWVKKF